VINDLDIFLLIQLIWHHINIVHYLHKDFLTVLFCCFYLIIFKGCPWTLWTFLVYRQTCSKRWYTRALYTKSVDWWQKDKRFLRLQTH